MNYSNQSIGDLIDTLHKQGGLIRRANKAGQPGRAWGLARRYLDINEELQTRMAAIAEEERQHAEIECEMAAQWFVRIPETARNRQDAP